MYSKGTPCSCPSTSAASLNAATVSFRGVARPRSDENFSCLIRTRPFVRISAIRGRVGELECSVADLLSNEVCTRVKVFGARMIN